MHMTIYPNDVTAQLLAALATAPGVPFAVRQLAEDTSQLHYKMGLSLLAASYQAALKRWGTKK